MSTGTDEKSESDFVLLLKSYLIEEFEKVHLLLQLAVQQSRATTPFNEDSLNSFFISDHEIDRILKKNSEAIDDSSQIETTRSLIYRQREKVALILAECEDKGFVPPTMRLQQSLGLSDFEIDVLLICLAPLYNTGYEKVIAYLNNDASQKLPTIRLIDLSLADNFVDRCRTRDFFSAHMPLVKWRLIKMSDGQSSGIINPSTTLLIDDRIASFLIGSSILDSKTELCLKVLNCDQSVNDLMLDEGLKLKLHSLTGYLQQELASEVNHILAFYGPSGGGKKRSAAILAASADIPLLSLRLEPILDNWELFQETICRVLREILVLRAGLLIEDFEVFSDETRDTAFFRRYLLEQLQDNCWLSFLISSKEFTLSNQSAWVRYIRLQFPIPDFPLRTAIWDHVLNNPGLIKLNVSSSELANRFKFNETQIRNAMASARDNAFSKSINGESISETDILSGCWSQCNQKLSKLALKIEAKLSWDDLVLPDIQITLLKEVSSHFRYKGVVFAQWGFNEKVLYGKGLSVLFSGPSGTGKTMAAGIIARDLKLELYKIDLSTVVSKYIGETEKNLSRIFQEAETSNAILFFDEADALFGKRSEINSSHDRYANIETSYLLQKMEEYEGITILASNLRQNMDQAFVRRMQFIIEFPFPDRKLREKLWKGIFPAKAPLHENIDYDFLASQLKLSGGNIKNIAINASYYAAEESSDIQIRHIMMAAKREYMKLGMSFLRSDMAPYFDLLEESS